MGNEKKGRVINASVQMTMVSAGGYPIACTVEGCKGMRPWHRATRSFLKCDTCGHLPEKSPDATSAPLKLDTAMDLHSHGVKLQEAGAEQVLISEAFLQAKEAAMHFVSECGKEVMESLLFYFGTRRRKVEDERPPVGKLVMTWRWHFLHQVWVVRALRMDAHGDWYKEDGSPAERPIYWSYEQVPNAPK